MTEEASHQDARDGPLGSTEAAGSRRSGPAVARSGRGRLSPVRRLSVVCLAAAAAAAVLYVITVGTPAGQLIGELILGGRPADFQATERAGRILATVSGYTVGIGLVLVVAIGLLQERPRLALAAAVAIVAANVTTQLLKEALLERIDLLDRLFYPLPNSFPSGHATAAASIAVGLIVVLPPLFRSPAIIAAAVAVASVAVSTLVLGWHRMADAIGGVFVATAWGAGLAAVLAWRRGVEIVGRRTAVAGHISARIAVTIGVVALLVGGFSYALAVADPLDVLLDLADRGGSPALFVLGTVVTVGASFVALGGLGLALRDVRLDPPPTSAKRTDPD
jgi:membrane-associated phospholipid phosphatase